MKKSELKKIEEIDWFLYLTRSLDIFSFICNGLAYKKIKYIGGIKNVGYLYDNKLVDYYRSEKEFKKNIDILRAKIIKSPEKIEKELLKGIEINKKSAKIIKNYAQRAKPVAGEEEVMRLVNFYIDLFAYGTVFPYMVGLAVDGLEAKKIKMLVDELRLVSYYTDFKNKILGDDFSRLMGDVNTFLSGKKIESRTGKFYFFILGNDILSGDDDETFKQIKNKLKKNEIKKTDQIKGVVAYAGIVRGQAKLVYGRQDFLKFNEGDILITINSNPFLMPVIKKCKAIVSDEGGMMCHASIIARELKKPCIIGTKIATQILKDGDLVEVDANNGVVKILKRAKD